ncbi:unnamed protein product [Camellia sinensis]
MGVKFMQASTHDYQFIILPLLKSFMRERFEVLVDKDTKKKADAAKEALLSEIELEAKKKNLESKKKNKKQRKKKDPKVTQGDELYVPQEETEEQVHFPVSYDGDYPSSEIVVAARADELGLQEEELKHEIEHDVEERKLKEKLEYQRQIEEEDKHTNLAKQNKDAVASIAAELEEMDVACSTDLGPGLRNDGENNCFINVIVQSLWHLRTFRGKFLRRSTPAHVHIKDPCIVCELHGIFTALREAKEGDDAVSPTTLRIALSKWQDCNFQQGQKNDASEALVAILDVLHWSFTFDSDTKLPGSSYTDSRNCDSDACIAHTVFGINIIENLNCNACNTAESRQMNNLWTWANASAIGQMKHDHPKSPFDELLKCDIREKHQNSCDGCRKPNIPHCILSTPPHVFTIVLCWESVVVPAHKIFATLGALSTKIDIGVIYEGLDPGNTHYLISMVCYVLEHYICFVYNRAKENWILYDDDKVKVIGSWDGVLAMCSRELLQPLILFFEVKGSVPVNPLEETKEPDNPWEAQKAERKRSGNHGKAKQDMDLGDEHPFSHPLQRQSNSIIYVLEGDLGNHSYGYTSMQNCVKDYTFKISTLDYKTDEEAFEGFICLKSCKGLYVVDGFMLDNSILLVERLGPDLATYFQNEYTTFVRRGKPNTQWFEFIKDKFCAIFRDILNGLRHIYSLQFVSGMMAGGTSVMNNNTAKLFFIHNPKSDFFYEVFEELVYLKEIIIEILLKPCGNWDGSIKMLDHYFRQLVVPVDLRCFVYGFCDENYLDNVDLDWLLDNSFFWNTMEKSKFIRKLDDILHVRQKLDSSFLDEYINDYLCNMYRVIAPDCWGSLVPKSGPAWDVYCRFETDIKADSSDNNSNRLQSVSRKIARYMRNLFEHANSSFPVHMRVNKEIIVQMGDDMFGGTAGLLRRACNNYFFISGQIAPSNTEWWDIMKFLLSEVDY